MYENLSSDEYVIIGYFFTGGIGSHPVLLSPTMDTIIESIGDEYNGYIETSVEDKVPDALICAYDDVGSWRIKGINRGLANSIISKIGGNYIGIGDSDDDDDDDDDGEDKLGLANEILKMVGEDPFNDSAYDANITIILDPKINTVYWSDVPEYEHSIWRPPYEEIPILERYYDVDDDESSIEIDLSIPNIGIMRLLKLMERKGVVPSGSI